MLDFIMWCRWMIFIYLAFLNCCLLVTAIESIHGSTSIHTHDMNFDDVSRARRSTPIVDTSHKTRSQNMCAPEMSFVKPMDCAELLQIGHKKSGVYTIWPRNKIMNGNQLDVYCDMGTDKRGWTVLQRRGNFLRPSDYFCKDWASYKIGFGDIERDFWLGNDNIFALTNQGLYSVRFDLIDVEGVHLYALYDTFFIENEENKYKLTIRDYSGTANDSMAWYNRQKFSTRDQDNDNSNCAGAYKGGWWYHTCQTSNLNGLYLYGKHESFYDSVVWSRWKLHHKSIYYRN